jgi:hypothetical protein
MKSITTILFLFILTSCGHAILFVDAFRQIKSRPHNTRLAQWRDWMFTLWTPDGNLQYARNFGTPRFDQVYLMRSKGCGRQVLLYSLDSSDGWGVLSEPLVGVYSPYGNCSGTVNGCGATTHIPPDMRPEPVALNIYPNPTTGTIMFELQRPAPSNMTLRVASLSGQALLDKRAEAGSALQQLDISGLPSGVYLVQVWSTGRVWTTSKIIKQ